MIPKVIHYCWFGRNPKPKLFNTCLKSWRTYCPDYKIIEWNEDNYAIEDSPLYVKQAYENKKWAFVTDYVRLQVVYENGGIYLDTDVELLKPLDGLLENDAFFGLEEGRYVNTGLGFGAVKGFTLLMELMSDYRNVSFIRDDGSFDLTPCPQRNTKIFTQHGLKQDDSFQTIENALIMSSDFLASRNWRTGEVQVTDNTIAIHHAEASWYTSRMKKEREKRFRKERMSHLPSKIGEKVLGKKGYQRIRRWIKG